MNLNTLRLLGALGILCCTSFYAHAQSTEQDDGLTPAERALINQTVTCYGGGQRDVEEKAAYDSNTNLRVRRHNSDPAKTDVDKRIQASQRIRNNCR